jgi:hypothetical protein
MPRGAEQVMGHCPTLDNWGVVGLPGLDGEKGEWGVQYIFILKVVSSEKKLR